MEPNRSPMGEFVSKKGPMAGGGVLKKSNGRWLGHKSTNARSLWQCTSLPCLMSILSTLVHRAQRQPRLANVCFVKIKIKYASHAYV